MIELTEVGNLLRLLAHIDARTVGEDDVKLWLAALQGDRISFEDARHAVIEQISVAPGDRVNIGHVVSRVRDRRRLRRASAGAGMALQEALRAIPPDAPDYRARVIEVLREPVPPNATAVGTPQPVAAGPSAAAARAARGRALVEAALAERRAARAAQGESGRGQSPAPQVTLPPPRRSDPQPLTRAVAEAAALLRPRRPSAERDQPS